MSEEEITKLKQEIERLKLEVIQDDLTGLKTRRYFIEEAKENIAMLPQLHDAYTRKVSMLSLSFLFCDIDNFKTINDTYGHEAGDKVLKAVADYLVQVMRVGDTVCRWGGEELVVSMPGSNELDAAAKAERVRAGVEVVVTGLLAQEYPGLVVTISIGVAGHTGEEEVEEMVWQADEAMYKAKTTGRNKVVRYSQIGLNVLN